MIAVSQPTVRTRCVRPCSSSTLAADSRTSRARSTRRRRIWRRLSSRRAVSSIWSMVWLMPVPDATRVGTTFSTGAESGPRVPSSSMDR